MLSNEHMREAARQAAKSKISSEDWYFTLSIFPAVFVMLLAAVPLLGHWQPQSGIFAVMPIAEGTHPVTALMALLMAVSLWFPVGGRGTVYAVCLLAGSCLLLAAGRFFPPLTSFYFLEAKDVATGTNTAAVFVVLSIARLALEGKRPAYGQFIAFLVPVVLFPALIGHIFKDDRLQGHMSLLTGAMAGLLLIGLLCRRGNMGLVASFSQMHSLRLDLAFAGISPVLVGLWLVYFKGYDAYQGIIAEVIASAVALNVLIQIVGMHRSHAIEQKRRDLEEQRVWDIVTDEVTGLYNRAALRQRFAEMAEDARQTRAALSIVVLDLDGFSGVNGQFGFEEGDNLLRDVAKAMLPVVRDDDFIGRAHADEFLVFLPGLPATKVAVIARDLCKAVRDLGRVTEDGPVTASAGVARWHLSETSKQLYERAHAALEVARIRGGDQACVAPGPDGADAVWRAVEERPVAGWASSGSSPEHLSGGGLAQADLASGSLDGWRLPEFSNLSQVRLDPADPPERSASER